MKLINSNPNWKRAEQLARFFQTIHEATEHKAPVGMMCGRVRDVNEVEDICGTPACHAGWFGIYHPSYLKQLQHDRRDYSTYGDIMAKFLGFPQEKNCLADWAFANPALWGNLNGLSMFTSAEAFGEYSFKVTLEDISNHWYKVAERLYNLQALNQQPQEKLNEETTTSAATNN